MELEHIHVGQRKLRNPEQVAAMLATLDEGGALPSVLLAELEDGTVYIQDGHHRCLAYVLAGRKTLEWGEYLLLQVERGRARFGKLTDPAVIKRLREIPSL